MWLLFTPLMLENSTYIGTHRNMQAQNPSLLGQRCSDTACWQQAGGCLLAGSRKVLLHYLGSQLCTAPALEDAETTQCKGSSIQSLLPTLFLGKEKSTKADAHAHKERKWRYKE